MTACLSARILVIDDSAFEQHVLSELLTAQNYRSVAAYNGQQGYELAASVLPDLILLDVRMPYLDGFGTCRLLKANPITAAIPVIFLSGENDAAARILALSIGAVDFVAKPYSGAELAARIMVHLRLARPGTVATEVAQPSSSEAHHVMVRAACRIIENDLANVPSLDEIAQQVGTYREKLSELFREETGVTVFDYVRRMRIERGAAMLRETALDVQTIALLVGYQNAANFATAFRASHGVSPTCYRKSPLTVHMG